MTRDRSRLTPVSGKKVGIAHWQKWIMPHPVFPAPGFAARGLAAPALAALAFGAILALPASPARAASYELCLQAPEQPYLWWREGTLDVGEDSFSFEAYLGAARCFRALGAGRVYAEANLGDRTPCDGPAIPPTRTRRVDVLIYEIPTPPDARPRMRCRVSRVDPPSAGLGDPQDEHAGVRVGRN